MSGRGFRKWVALFVVSAFFAVSFGPFIGHTSDSDRAPGVLDARIPFARLGAGDVRSEIPAQPFADVPTSADYADISVVGGWNLISLPLITLSTLPDALADRGGDTTWNRAMWYDPLDSQDPWKQYNSGWLAPLNQLTSVSVKMGLWVNITDAGSDGILSISGYEPTTTQIQLRAGWNLVGYPARVDTTYNIASLKAATGATLVEGFSAGATYKTAVLADAAVMKKGAGYWVKVPADVVWTVVNPEPIRQTAEFERMQGVLIRYPLGIPYALIAEMSEDAKVYTLLRSTYLSQAQNNYASNGVNMANCVWITATTDSYWTRDFGPWWITGEASDFGIVDFPYNRPRPNDDAVPGVVASYLGVPMDYMDVSTTGGNYMTDGYGASVSTDLVLEENTGLTESEIRQFHKDYLNIDNYHIVADVNGEYIKHIDCWAKFLDADKIMIRSVPTSHAQYDEIEAAVDYWESQVSSWGNTYQVFRVYTPNDEPYSNCLILNDKVLLPIMGGSWDDEAIASYQAAMPGYEIIGVAENPSYPWESTDALHCRTRGIPDQGTLFVKHYPVVEPVPASKPMEIIAKVMAYSGSNLTGQVLQWKLSTEPSYHAVPMSQIAGAYYGAFIPGQASGATVQYYIQASDASGRSETSPIIGSPDPHVFTTG